MRIVIIAIVIVLLYLVYINEKGKKKPAKVRYVNILPPPRQAMTIPPFGVFILEKHRGSEVIHRHEKCHWQQYQEKGLLSFYTDYFGHTIEHGYSGNEMEKECYIKENYKL